MRYSFACTMCIVLLATCGPTTENGSVVIPTHDAMATDTITAEWPGYYTGTLPCADCPGIETTLWVRSDSTFILQQKYLDHDDTRDGTIGQWHTVNGLMTIGYTGDKPEFYRYTDKGLLMVDEMGAASTSDLNYTLEKLADEIGDAIPRMRLTGTYTFKADAHSFQPCGSNFTWPCAAGMDMGEEEGEPLVTFTNADLEKAYSNAGKKEGDPWVIEVICTMGMGVAMEGDGADEYFYLEQVLKDAGQCP
ncbi:MAG: copper resistance protein NlpE N-terminal domain-containing protein [Flavobacteriales bacterium]